MKSHLVAAVERSQRLRHERPAAAEALGAGVRFGGKILAEGPSGAAKGAASAGPGLKRALDARDSRPIHAATEQAFGIGYDDDAIRPESKEHGMDLASRLPWGDLSIAESSEMQRGIEMGLWPTDRDAEPAAPTKAFNDGRLAGDGILHRAGSPTADLSLGFLEGSRLEHLNRLSPEHANVRGRAAAEDNPIWARQHHPEWTGPVPAAETPSAPDGVSEPRDADDALAVEPSIEIASDSRGLGAIDTPADPPAVEKPSALGEGAEAAPLGGEPGVAPGLPAAGTVVEPSTGAAGDAAVPAGELEAPDADNPEPSAGADGAAPAGHGPEAPKADYAPPEVPAEPSEPMPTPDPVPAWAQGPLQADPGAEGLGAA